MHSWEDKHIQQKQIAVYKCKKTSQAECSEQQLCYWVSLTTEGEMTQHGWQSLCAEWLWSQASGLVRGRRWEQKNIPCGPWSSWDAASLLLDIYLYSGLVHASQTWREASSSPCEALQHGSLWACVQDLEDAATNPIRIPFSSCLAEEVLKFPGYLLICWEQRYLRWF